LGTVRDKIVISLDIFANEINIIYLWSEFK